MKRLAWVFALLLLIACRVQAAQQSGSLAYSRLTQGTWQIWQRDLASSHEEQMTFSEGDKRYPAWMPDGSVIYQTSNHGGFIARKQQQENPVLKELWPMTGLAASPDGKRMAFSRLLTDLADSANVWITDGGAQRMITREPGIQYNPSWSPDGRKLAYSGGKGYGTYEIYVVDVESGARLRLTNNKTHEFLPAWSPDGSLIAFVSDAGGSFDIWAIHPDGTGLKQLTSTPSIETRPAWSPDGKSIAFATQRAGRMEVWVMDADGANSRLLVQAEEGACDPAWR